MQPWHKHSEGLAAACEAVVKVWAPGEPANEVKIFEGTSVYAVDLSPNNKVLAVGGDKSQISLYSSTSQASGDRSVGKIPNLPDGSVDSITCLKFLPDTSLLGGCKDGSVLLWALRQQSAGSRKFDGLTGSATALTVREPMDLLAASSSYGQVLLFDFKTGRCRKALQKEGSGAAPATQLAFSRLRPGLLAAGTAAGQVLLWDLDQGPQAAQAITLPTHKTAVTGLVWSEKDADVLISCGSDGRLKATDVRAQQVCWSVSAKQGFTSLSAKWDGHLLAVGTTAGSVLVQDVRNTKQPLSMQQFSDSKPVSTICWFHPVKGQNRPTAAATSAAAAAAAAPVSAATPAAAATGSTGARASSGGGAAAAAAAAAAPGGFSSSVGGGLASEASTGSLSADGGIRIMSPVQLYGSPSDPDMKAAADAIAAQAAAAMHTPELGSLHTPADSGISGAGLAPFMFTPGIGLPLAGFGGTTPEFNVMAAAAATAGTEATPISRPTARPGVPPAAAGAGGLGFAGQVGGSSSILTGGGNVTAGSILAGGGSVNTAGAAAESVAATASLMGLAKQRAAGTTRALDSNKLAAAVQQKPGVPTAGPAMATTSSVPRGPVSRAGSSSSSSLPLTAAGTAAAKSSGAAGAAASNVASSRAGLAVGGAAGAAQGAAAAAAAAAPSPSSRCSSRTEVPDVTAAAAAAVEGSSRPASAGSTGAGGSGNSSSRPGSAGAGGASSPTDAAPAGVFLSSGGGGGGGVTPAGLREDVFKAYIDQQMAELRQDVKNMHLDMLRQFHQAQMDLVSVVDGLAQRQDQLAEAVAGLTAALVQQQGLGAGKGQPGAQWQQPGAIGVLPWL